MKFHLKFLSLALKRGNVTITLSDVNYFWGQMGAGKSSIAKLIDYCLGGDIKLTPAMQSEFVSATIELDLQRSRLKLERPRDSTLVLAEWDLGAGACQVSIPARDSAGEVVPETEVENLSDLIFWLSGIVPPRVRTSKLKQDSELRRLSMRDLLWYCYLDQDSMDSSFFHLEEGAHTFKQLKSRDVIRYVIGFHDEKVAELEAQLDALRAERRALTASLNGIVRVLRDVGVDSEEQITGRVAGLRERANAADQEIILLKKQSRSQVTTHNVEAIRAEALQLDEELVKVDAAIRDLRKSLDNDTRHLNELQTLSLKFKRSVSAKAILADVAFDWCPRCAQMLPDRDPGMCKVCNQRDTDITPDPTQEAIIDRDIKGRSAELREIIERHNAKLDRLRLDREQVCARKARVERERNEAVAEQDSAYLSNYLAKERERASLIQEAESLASLVKLAQAVEKQRQQIATVEVRENQLRLQLTQARTEAESDAENLDRLKGLYLDCLLRTGIPGIKSDDTVEIPTKTFFPSLKGARQDEQQITSFATISSGGKKNLFKACFAVAIHRVAASLKAPLPEMLLIDSAMKNISERENRAQFEGFYRMLYELKGGELKDTQMIFIDKEFLPPPADVEVQVTDRQMKPDDDKASPLIPYYRGK